MAEAKANILMILLDHTFPPDIRVEKEALTLTKNYNIFLLTNRKLSEKYSEVHEGIFILRMDRPFSKIRVLSYLTDRLASLLKIALIVSQYKIKILHVHDLPYALPVTLLGKVFRKKVIFDMHENYEGLHSQELAIKFGEETGARTQLGRLWLLYVRLSERLACKLATAVIVVVEENAERLIHFGISKDKIVVVSNTADLERLKKFENKKLKRLFGSKFVVSYVGGFGHHRGLDTLIKALPTIVQKTPHMHLLIIGDHSVKQKEELENLSKQLGIREHVTFTGWVSFERAMEYMLVSDVSVIPYHSTPLTNATVPHKIFQAMYFKKPVLVSDVKPLKRIVEETDCGLIFQAGNYTQLSDVILKLMDNPKLMEEMGERGRKAVESKYNWNADGRRLLQLYSELN